MSYILFSENYLAHHGILGQKWGVRRYQNADGTLKEAGQKRCAKQLDRDEKKFYNEYGKTWWKTYNRASAEFNSKIGEVNARHENDGDYGSYYETKAGQAYIRDVSDTWKGIYTRHLLTEYGESPKQGKAWVDNAPLMNQYSDFLHEVEIKYGAK